MTPRLAHPATQLAIGAVGVVLAMSAWFSTSAVLPELRIHLSIGDVAASWLVIVVQIGFVLGAVVSATTGLADRVAPRTLLAIGAGLSAVVNGAITLVDSFAVVLVLRALTGASLALVYPAAMKAMSGWYRTGRGFALGVMVGALTIGSAVPHLVGAIGDLDWRTVLWSVSALTVCGGLLVVVLARPGPHLVQTAGFDAGRIRSLVGSRPFRLATLGYFGHMWELYAMWAWIPVFALDVLDGAERSSSLLAFATIAAGAVGSVHAGRFSDRRSRSLAAGRAMTLSGSMALVVGFLVEAPWPVVVLGLLVWGYAVVADSAQFSTIVTEVVPAESVGTALTVQLASGFVLTVVTIFVVPWVRDTSGWGLAFAMLAVGPALGVWAMRQLDAGTDQAGMVTVRS